MLSRYQNNGTGRDTYVNSVYKKGTAPSVPKIVEPYTPIRQDMQRSLRLSQRIQPLSPDNLSGTMSSTAGSSPGNSPTSPNNSLAVGTMHPSPRKQGNNAPRISAAAMESLATTYINRDMSSPYRQRSGGIRVAPHNAASARVDGNGGISPTRPFNVKQYMYESTQGRAWRTGKVYQPDHAEPVRTNLPEIRAKYQSYQ